ncbi:arylamine N-acetyltransferase family protein [Sphingomonas xanthus]|uniref:Arylamine N-acetyltransferase n=1 Tax=Sphingomonas xanthus TaxID=2594473 RepID=A0A516INP8_9SPHN|nr:arylamine N-acetyltransferase [Sphingomonas xanthus]QDP18540.1 arylamine N-acetyltransferase [Sphingomonas xanthus]
MYTPVDLASYCRRIGYCGPLVPTLTTLTDLQRQHIAAIPFEAIDILLGNGTDIRPEAVDSKLLGRKRGGCCLEQNMLFARVLNQIGFRIEIMMGRVFRGSPPNDPQPRTHLATCVTIEGDRWLADVAFGAYVPPEPLRMEVDVAQATQFDTYRVVQKLNGFSLEVLIGAQWECLYWLSTDPIYPSDLQMANWHVTTHPDSPFRRQLIAARTTPSARFALLENRLTTHFPDGRREQSILSAIEVEAALSEQFGLEVAPSWRSTLERAALAGAGN